MRHSKSLRLLLAVRPESRINSSHVLGIEYPGRATFGWAASFYIWLCVYLIVRCVSQAMHVLQWSTEDMQ